MTGHWAAVLALGLCATLQLSQPADAQAQRPARPPPVAEPTPEPAPAPYEPQLVELAEIMGSLAYLRTLCGGSEAQLWSERMTALIDTEGRTAQRRERLTGAFNRGFRAYATTHRLCTDVSQEASERLAKDGDRLARALAGRYGG